MGGIRVGWKVYAVIGKIAPDANIGQDTLITIRISTDDGLSDAYTVVWPYEETDHFEIVRRSDPIDFDLYLGEGVRYLRIDVEANGYAYVLLMDFIVYNP